MYLVGQSIRLKRMDISRYIVRVSIILKEFVLSTAVRQGKGMSPGCRKGFAVASVRMGRARKRHDMRLGSEAQTRVSISLPFGAVTLRKHIESRTCAGTCRGERMQ